MKNRHSAASVAQSAESQKLDFLAEVRSHDIRKEVPITQTMRIRADARMQQIVAESPSTAARASGITASNRILATGALKRWGLRLAAIPVVATAIVAGTVMIPASHNPQNGFGGWTAIPTAVAAPLLGPAEEACEERLNWTQNLWAGRDVPFKGWEPLPYVESGPVVAEQRGEWVLLMYQSDEIQMAGCVVRMADGVAEVRNDWFMHGMGGSWSNSGGEFDADGNWVDPDGADGLDFSMRGRIWPEPAADSGVGWWHYQRVFMPGFGPMFLFTAGVADDVEAVNIPISNGQMVGATIANGSAVAWWPAELGEIEHPEGRPFNFRMTLEVSYTDGTTEIVHSLWFARPRTEQDMWRSWNQTPRP